MRILRKILGAAILLFVFSCLITAISLKIGFVATLAILGLSIGITILIAFGIFLLTS